MLNIYIYIYSLWFSSEFMGITNPRDEKMAKKKKNVLCIKTKLFIVPPFRIKKEIIH